MAGLRDGAHFCKARIIIYRNDKLNTFLENCGGIEREYNLSDIIIFAWACGMGTYLLLSEGQPGKPYKH